MSKKKAKKKFNVEDVLRARMLLRACCNLDLKNLEFVDDNGNPVEPVRWTTISKEYVKGELVKEEEFQKSWEEEIDDFEFTGLCSYDFIEMSFASAKVFGKKYKKLQR